jgi:hypothetical protein
MANKYKYYVNVGNVGNLEHPNIRAATKCYREYVKISKAGLGRAGGEDVCLMVEGEPSLEFSYYDYVITVQERKCQRLERTLVEEKAILNRLCQEQEEVN